MKRYWIFGLAVLILAGLSPVTYAGNGSWRNDWRRHRGNNTTVVIDDNNDDNYNYNNANYLGYPPWYRLNYYTPWLSDYRNGTAWTRIPSSHAAEGYGMPPTYNTLPSGYYNWLAGNNMGNSALTWDNSLAASMPPPAYNPTAPNPAYNTMPARTSLAGNDIVVVVQRELRRRGFYGGIINGLSDAPTRAAIRSYESSAGLPATGGIIGVDLLRSLGLL